MIIWAWSSGSARRLVENMRDGPIYIELTGLSKSDLHDLWSYGLDRNPHKQWPTQVRPWPA